jgi:hypothetical protein
MGGDQESAAGLRQALGLTSDKVPWVTEGRLCSLVPALDINGKKMQLSFDLPLVELL